MAELRWILLALGILLLVGVYLWGRKSLLRSEVSPRSARRRRAEPRISSEDEPVSSDLLFTRPGEHGEPTIENALPPADRAGDDLPDAGTPERQSGEPEFAGDLEESSGEAADAPAAHEPSTLAPERVVALRFVPRASLLDAAKVVDALRDAGLEHGRYGIFHYPDPTHPKEPRFSVASLTEPGSFDLERLAEKPLPGMSFFMVLPGIGDPVERFDTMVGTARALAHELDAELFDDRGSSWSIQRERYIREELISYRLQLAPS